ncbi:hypothetical protein FF2_024882 [Malus domestica]
MVVATSMSDCLEYVEDAGDATEDDKLGDGEMGKKKKKKDAEVAASAWRITASGEKLLNLRVLRGSDRA